MKLIACLIILFILISGCKCKFAKLPHTLAYNSIKESKENDAFVCEAQPESPSIKINGKDYFFEEAWVEHPHKQGTYHDTIYDKDYWIVVKFRNDPNDSAALQSIKKGGSNAVDRFWVGTDSSGLVKDTFRIRYRDNPDSAKKKVFLFFRKK